MFALRNGISTVEASMYWTHSHAQIVQLIAQADIMEVFYVEENRSAILYHRINYGVRYVLK